MGNIDFVLWICIFPIAMSVWGILDTKERIMTNRKLLTAKDNSKLGDIFFVMWVVVALLLFG